MTDHYAQAAVDCPRCGERYVDLDIHAYVTAGHTPTDFADMLARLTVAHADTCTPRRAPIPRADRRRRACWWAGALTLPVAWGLLAVVHA
ncbi:hypothetical protein, partial [Isoptericola hypogeus]|uniref:hypothetical protein n=1 Tax=Isoptericola hypogeus TaxID=300179 RepID=UPI0031DABAA3